MTVISLKNWSRHQHYKNRDPPWVKLYRDILTSESWVVGTDLSRLLQVACILLAARYSNQIPRSWNVLRKVTSLDCTEAEFEAALAHLISTNFLEIQVRVATPKECEQLASKALDKCSSEESRAEKSRAEGDARTRDGVPHGTRDVGTALTGMSMAEEALAGVLNAWRDIEGCDHEAMTQWLAHWSRKHDGRDMPGHQRIATAKLLAGLGDSATQRRAVLTAESAGWKSLRHGDGKAPRQTPQEAAAAKRAESERIEWQNLAERAERIDFRPRTAMDDLAGYRILVERAERNQPRVGSKPIAELLGRQPS